jgi:hypothetical protein
MNRRILIGYQLAISLSDTTTGALLMIAPSFTLGLMRLHVPADALPYLSFIGSFVFAVGLSCLYGARLMLRRANPSKLQIVWLLTAIIRASVATFVIAQILSQTLEPGWITVAFTDGACVLFQAIGLRQGWIAHVAR